MPEGFSVNPNSSAVGGVETGGDISSAVISYFGTKANDAAKKTQEAIKKAKTDSNINKAVEGARGQISQDGSKSRISSGAGLESFLQSLASKGNKQAKDLLASMRDGEWTAAETSAANGLFDAALRQGGQGGGSVNDDAVNLALVQAAFQEFQTASNGMSAVVKKSGDTKDSIANRLA